MLPLVTYSLLLAGIVIGQVVRIPLRPGGDLALRLADVITFGVIAVWAMKLIYDLIKAKQWLIRLNRTDWLFLAFQIVLVLTFLPSLGQFNHNELLIGFGYLVRLEAYLMLYWVARSWGQAVSPQLYQRYFLWATVIVAIVGFVQLATFGDFRFMADFGWDPHVGRLLSTFYDPNFVAIFLGLGLIINTTFLCYGQIRYRRWHYLIGLILLVAMYLTFSRSGILSTALVMILLGFRRHWKAGLLITAIFALIMLLPGRLGSRFSSLVTSTKIESGQGGLIVTSGDNDTGSQRLLSWKRAFEVIKSEPLTGVGYNNFGPATAKLGLRKEAEESIGSAQASDSSLLDIWATSGIIGLGLFIWFAFRLLKKSLLVPSRLLLDPNYTWRYAFGLTVLAIGVDSTFINSLLYPQLLIYWIVFAALLVSSPSEN